MLRLLVVALLAANLLFWAWHQPAVTTALGLGAPADAGREPGRLARQVRPEAVRLLPAEPGAVAPAPTAPPAIAPADVSAPIAAPAEAPAASAAPASLAAAAPGLCLEAGPFDEAGAAAAARELARAGVAPGGWVDSRRELPGRWIVYMGRYTEREALQRKREELDRLDLNARELRSPPELAPGLALGEFGAQADAQARLERLQARGVRTARVVQLPSPGAEHRLRAPAVPRDVAEQLVAQAPRNGRARWRPC